MKPEQIKRTIAALGSGRYTKARHSLAVIDDGKPGHWLPRMEYWSQEELKEFYAMPRGRDRAVPHALIALMFMGWGGKE